MRESVFYCVTTLLKYLNDYLSLFLIDNYQVIFFLLLIKYFIEIKTIK